jgi:heat shock protein HtpX
MKLEFGGKLAPMSMKGFSVGALAAVLCLQSFTLVRAQLPSIQKMGPELNVQIRLEPTGEGTLGAWRSNDAGNLVSLLPGTLGCQSGLKVDENGGNAIRCARALRRDGLALEAVLDLAPIARKLDGSTGIELYVNTPRLGFETSSLAMTEEVDGPRLNRTTQFAVGVVPAPIKIRFGYEPAQLAGVYLPLLALALAITLIATIMARAGFEGLALSAILLGTMVWMYASAQLQADAPLRILLFGSPLASFAALFIDLWPPLFCVAIGVAIGSRMRGGPLRNATFSQVCGTYAVIPLLLTSVVGALPSMGEGGWPVVACWLAAAPVFLLLRRAWNRARARSRVQQLTAGELMERVSALAARAGSPQVKLYISFSTRSQIANAFALPGKSIFLTAPLVRSLSKRELDAVAAHELSHVRVSNRGGWSALCIAMLLCETPARELLYYLPGGLLAAMIFPIAVFFIALHGTRKREYAADLGAAGLTGDARAMISSLARIARNNSQPLGLNAMAEWFSSHPSTLKRIGALAAAARLDKAEVETLCSIDQPGESYEIPPEEHSGDIFTPAWQQTNAGIYSWAIVLGSSGAGVLVAWLINKFAGFGVVPILGGIALGCVLTKSIAALTMASNYARLRRKLMEKLGVGGKLVGLALDGEARFYGSFRFSDAGLLRFESGRLCYRSERITIALNPADVLEVGMVAAAPSNWFRRQPMVRFRNPQSGQANAFIIHTLDWFATQRRMFRKIERWKATETSTEKTSIDGFSPVSGQPFSNLTIAAVARAFPFTGGVALVAAIVTCLIVRANWEFVAWALVVTACAFTSMLLPAMLYRPPTPLPTIEPQSNAGTN